MALLMLSLLEAALSFSLVTCSSDIEYYGKVIGDLQSTSRGIKGSVYAVDDYTIFLKEFSYDGTAPEAQFWAGNDSWLNQDGILIPDEEGKSDPLGIYRGQDLVLKLPEETRVTDLRIFGVWDKTYGDLGSVDIPDDLDPPREMTLGPFSSPVRSGPVVLKNSRTLLAPRVKAQCNHTDLEFLVGNGSVSSLNGSRVLLKEVISSGAEGMGPTTTTLTFPSGVTVLDVSWVAVRCAADHNEGPGPLLGHLVLPRSPLNVPPAPLLTSTTLEESARDNKELGAGYWGTPLGRLQNTDHGVTGTIYAVSEDTIMIRGFSYDGRAPDAHFWSGSTDNPSPQGFIIPNERNSFNNLGTYRGRNLILRLPDGWTLRDIGWIAVWCKAFNANFGHVILPRNLRVPEEVVLGPLPTLAHGVRSGPVRIVDEQTIFIPKMFYDGQAPDAYFLVGKGQRIQHRNAVKLSRNGSFSRLRGAMRGEDVLLKIPGEGSVRDFDWLSVYCILARENFGHVVFPRDLRVPPVLKERGRKTDDNSDRTREYYGKRLGEFQDAVHRVHGTVFAASNNTLFLKGFSYDGLGPETFFWVGTDSHKPSSTGQPLPDENGSIGELKAYEDKDLLIQLPGEETLKNIKYLSIWSKRITGSFGHVTFPSPLELPSPRTLGHLPSFAHGVSSGQVQVLDSKTLLLKDLHYDGRAPDAFFLVGKGPYPLPNGTKVPDENGSLRKIHGYNGQTVTLRLPGNLTVFDIDWFSLYCITYTENFGHVFIPNDLNVPADLVTLYRKARKWENCETIFPDVMQVSWTLEPEHIHIQLQGTAKPNEYLSFGLSPDTEESRMLGSDVVLTFQRSSSIKGQALDYHLSAKAQCSDGVGACPDDKVEGTDDVTVTSTQRTGDLLTVSYRRPLKAGDSRDLSVETGRPIAVVAAVGHLDSRDQAGFHHTHYTKTTVKIHFGRQASGLGSCKDLEETRIARKDSEQAADVGPEVEQEVQPDVEVKPEVEPELRPDVKPEVEAKEKPKVESEVKAKEKPKVESEVKAEGRTEVEDHEEVDVAWNRGKVPPEVGLFQARLGPTGGEKGYNAITGRHSWGYAWWINGELIPELHVTRGRTYTFQVEGGPRHPLYITENPQGGGSQYPEQLGKPGHRSYAGLVKNSTSNEYSPIGVGRLCEWKHTEESENYDSYEIFKSGLTPICQEGHPGTFFWTPDHDTPDTVYYQCFVHLNFGWKILVKDP